MEYLAWGRSVSPGPALRDRGHRGGALVFLQTLSLMGDWCRQESMTRFETDTIKPKETTVKGEMRMTRLIHFVHSDTDDGSGRRYSSYGRNSFLS